MPPAIIDIARRLEGPPIPEGFHTVTPYVLAKGADKVMSFMEQAFDATVHLRVPDTSGGIMHAQMQIGDSMIELSDGGGPFADAVHAALGRAGRGRHPSARAQSGASSVYEPTDQVYGDRECGVLDSAGNHWFIATFKKDVPKEEVERQMAASKK
jgi:uncharacterized glyoxalase superfamily protein PhnB